MKSLSALCICLCLAVSVAFTQIPNGVAKDTDRVHVDEILQRYLAAYQHKNIQELLALWPELERQKKEYDKIKHHFADASLSDEQMMVTPVEVRSVSDGALVRVQRIEKFVKSESTSSSYLGDNRAGGMPAQDPGPYRSVKKKDIKKSDEVWIKMRRTGEQWTIVSIGEKNAPPDTRPVV